MKRAQSIALGFGVLLLAGPVASAAEEMAATKAKLVITGYIQDGTAGNKPVSGSTTSSTIEFKKLADCTAAIASVPDTATRNSSFRYDAFCVKFD